MLFSSFITFIVTYIHVLSENFKTLKLIFCPVFNVLADFSSRIFSFQPFPSVRGGHSVSSFSKPFCLQHLSPLHQLPPYLLSLHLKIFFGLPLFLFPGNSISIIFLPTYSWSLLITCPYHLSLPSSSFLTVLP